MHFTVASTSWKYRVLILFRATWEQTVNLSGSILKSGESPIAIEKCPSAAYRTLIPLNLLTSR